MCEENTAYAEHGIQNWVSPSEIARLLLMRRVPKSPPGYEPSVYRVLGVIIPDLDKVMQMEISKLPIRQARSCPYICALPSWQVSPLSRMPGPKCFACRVGI